METFSTLLAICVGNSPITIEFPTQRPVTQSFGVFFDLRLNKRLSKQSWGWWFETLSCPLWCHCNALQVWAVKKNSCWKMHISKSIPRIFTIFIYFIWFHASHYVWSIIVHMYICIYIYTHIHIYVRTYVHTYIYIPGELGFVYLLLYCAGLCSQIIQHIMAWWSYSFVRMLLYLIIIIMQTYLKVLNF